MKISKYQSTVHDYIVITEIKNDDNIKEILDRKDGVGADYLIIVKSIPYYDCEVSVYSKDGKCFDNGALLVVGHLLYKKTNEEGNHFIVSCNNEGYELFICDNVITLMRQNPLVIKKCYFAKIDRYVYKIENKRLE